MRHTLPAGSAHTAKPSLLPLRALRFAGPGESLGLAHKQIPVSFACHRAIHVQLVAFAGNGRTGDHAEGPRGGV